jgi:aspartokinase
MVILKFGGTSVGTKEALSALISVLKDSDHCGAKHKAGHIVVVSALSGMTDALISSAREAAGITSQSSGITAQSDSGTTDGKGKLCPSLEEMKKRHLEISGFFLKGPEQKDADAKIEESFAELSRMLDGIAILKELSPRSLDRIMSCGEVLSAPLIASVLRSSGMEAEFLDSRELILTDDSYGAARFQPEESYRRIQERVKQGRPGTL